MPGFSAKDLRGVTEKKEMEKAAEAIRKRKEAEAEENERREVFFSGEIKKAQYEQLWVRLQRAAEEGRNELMVGKFPCHWTTDRGRAINNQDPAWPDTLQGIAKTFVEYFDREMKPKGFKLRLEIINFPGGMPGDVGAFIGW
ncbi:MAG: hypothetical protein AAF479_17995 [Pseudomonadota bacterium]